MSGYIGTQPVPQATQTRQTFTAIASQTSFATAGYTPQFLDVYLNGVHLLDGTDYTATNGSDVVLTTGAATDDILEVVSYTPFEVADQTFTGTTTVTQSASGAGGWNEALVLKGTYPLLALHETTTDKYSRIGNDGDGSIQFFVNGTSGDVGTNAAGIDPSGDLYLSGGVYLGGTGSANKLDDYEEGTWTPDFEFDIGGTGITYGSRSGHYTKIGRMVHIQFTMEVTGGVSASDYFVRIALPFATSNVGNQFGRTYIANTNRSGFNVATEAGTSSMLCFTTNGQSDYSRGDDIAGTTWVGGSLSYRTTE